MRLGILTSHPIQYQAPWFRALAKEVDVQVFFAHQPGAAQQGEGFGRSFQWDVDLLAGYAHRFLKNVATNPEPSRYSGCDTPEIRDFICTGKFDAFIVNGWHLKCYWQAIRACRKAGIPVLVRGDSQLLTPRSRLKTWIKKLTYRWLLRRFDGFLVVGQRNAEYLAHYGVSKSKMFPVPHFVDNEWFAERAAEGRGQRVVARRRWGIADDAFCVLFCGKFGAKKRPLDLVEAARRFAIRNSTPAKLHLLFVGSGELSAPLRNHCRVVFDADISSSQFSVSNSKNPVASFVGFKNQTELPACYAAADVLVLPSESETWGLVVNEAMACGLPAIVSDAVGCAPDLIIPGRTGFTYPMGDVAALADRLGQISELRQRGWDFSAELKGKMNDYSVAAAVRGTLKALAEF